MTIEDALLELKQKVETAIFEYTEQGVTPPRYLLESRFYLSNFSGGGGGGGGSTDMTETNSRLGARNEAPASSPTAPSGLNGLFRFLLQKIITTVNGIKVDGSSVTQPIAGVVSVSNLPATQSIAGVVDVGNLPAIQPVSGAISVSNFPTTQPISATALPLPANAATEITLGQIRDRLTIPSATIITSASPQFTSVSGSEKLFTVPVGFEWQLVSFYSELTTSATAGNRQLTLRIEDSSGNIFGRYPVGTTQSASSLRRYNHAIGLPDLQSFRDTDKLQTPVPPLILPAGFRIRILDAAVIDAVADALVVRGLIQQRGL